MSNQINDSFKIAFYDRFFSASEKKNTKSVNEIVDPKWANDCTHLYKTFKGSTDFNILRRMFETDSVSFQFTELLDWMNVTLKDVNFDKIRISFGVYNRELVDSSGKPVDSEGRLTVFLWPYLGFKRATRIVVKSGRETEEEVEPFNIGDLHP